MPFVHSTVPSSMTHRFTADYASLKTCLRSLVAQISDLYTCSCIIPNIFNCSCHCKYLDMCWSADLSNNTCLWCILPTTTICYLTICCLLLIHYVTQWPVTFWPHSVVIHGRSHGQLLHQVSELVNNANAAVNMCIARSADSWVISHSSDFQFTQQLAQCCYFQTITHYSELSGRLSPYSFNSCKF